jgi:xylulokinase
MSLILALDLGTSSAKSLLMREDGKVLHVHSEPYPSYSPQPGWVEQQPTEWITAAIASAQVVLNDAAPGEVSVISVSGHMSGVVLIDADGNPLGPCITLSDIRSSSQTARIADLWGNEIRQLTGNPVINAFAAPKLLWLKEHRPEFFDAAAMLLFPKDYLRFCLTGRLATDATDAGNSLFFDPLRGEWDKSLAAAMGIQGSMLPDILQPGEIAGYLSAPLARLLSLPEGIPVAAGAADMATSALGTGAVAPGSTVLTVGTSATMLTVSTDIHNLGFGKVTYHPHALPGLFYSLGSHFAGGLSLNWLSGLLHTEVSYEKLQELGALAREVDAGSGGVQFLPFLAGSGSPHFNASMRGSFLGLSSYTGRAELFRAVLEGITYNLKETLGLMEQIGGKEIQRLRVGGGGSKIPLWPELMAHVFDKPVDLLSQADASAMGTAMLGGYAVGMFPDLRVISERLTLPTASHRPDLATSQQYAEQYRLYQRYYEALEPLYTQHFKSNR